MKNKLFNLLFIYSFKLHTKMRILILLLTTAPMLLMFSACSITYKTQNLTQPVVLSNKVGVQGTDLPQNATSMGNVEGEVLYEKMITSTSEKTTEKANADVDFLSCLQTRPDRCVTNLYFRVKNYQYVLFSGGKSLIEYYGECKEIQKQK